MSNALKSSLRIGAGKFRRGAGVRRACGVLAIASLSATAAPIIASAKQPGTVHCYGGWCHRVNTVDEVAGMIGRRGLVKASYYDDCRRDQFNPCGLTSSGALFEPHLPDNAASPIFPDGSVLLVFNRQTGKAAVVRINSAGPYHGDRTLDVSRATATALGFERQGVAELEVSVLKAPNADEARYKKLRRYAKVPGYMGAFSSFEDAHLEAMQRINLELERPPHMATASADFETVVPWWPSRLTGEAQLRLPALYVVAQPLQTSEVIAAAPPPMTSLNSAAMGSEIKAGPAQIAAINPRNDAVTLSVTAREMVSWQDRLSAFVELARAAARPDVPARLFPAGETESGGLKDRFWAFVQYARNQARVTRHAPHEPVTFVSHLDDSAGDYTNH